MEEKSHESKSYKELDKYITANTILEVESERRLKELLGENKDNIICVEVITPEADNTNLETDNEDVLESRNSDENPQEKNSSKSPPLNTKGNKKNVTKK